MGCNQPYSDPLIDGRHTPDAKRTEAGKRVEPPYPASHPRGELNLFWRHLHISLVCLLAYHPRYFLSSFFFHWMSLTARKASKNNTAYLGQRASQ